MRMARMAENPQPGDPCVKALTAVAGRKLSRCLWILRDGDNIGGGNQR